MTLSIQLVLYNGSPYLLPLLTSLKKQSNQDWTLYVRDQSPDSAERRAALHALQASGTHAIIDASHENLGFAGGHQRLFERHDADIVFLLNQDALLGPRYIEEVRHVFEEERVGSAAGVIFQGSFCDGKWHKKDSIDSMGLVRRRTHKVEDIKNVEHKFDSTPFEVFGVSGCLPMYRRSAIERASMDGRLFDARYFMYKEDVDVAYRLERAEYKTLTVPRALAWHRRTFGQQARAVQTPNALLQSYRNHLWNLLSHASAPSMRRDVWAILPYECAKAAYMIATNPRLWWRAVLETYRMFPELKSKSAWYEARTH